MLSNNKVLFKVIMGASMPILSDRMFQGVCSSFTMGAWCSGEGGGDCQKRRGERGFPPSLLP